MPETVMERLSILVAAKGRAQVSLIFENGGTPIWYQIRNPSHGVTGAGGVRAAGIFFKVEVVFGQACSGRPVASSARAAMKCALAKPSCGSVCTLRALTTASSNFWVSSWAYA